MGWGAKMAAALNAAATVDEVESWLSENAAPLANCLSDAPKIRARLDAIAKERLKDLPRANDALTAEVVDGEPEPSVLEAG